MFESNRACAHASEAAGPAVRSYISPRLAAAGLAAFLVVGLPGTAFASPPDDAAEAICTNSGNGGPNNGQGLGNVGEDGGEGAHGHTVQAGDNENAATVVCAPQVTEETEAPAVDDDLDPAVVVEGDDALQGVTDGDDVLGHGAVVAVPTGEEPVVVLPTPQHTKVDAPVVHRPAKQVVKVAPAAVVAPEERKRGTWKDSATQGTVDEILGGHGANRPAVVVAPAALASATAAPARSAPATAAPATDVLPATGAGDDLGLLAVTGLGMVLAGIASLVGRRRVTTG